MQAVAAAHETPVSTACGTLIDRAAFGGSGGLSARQRVPSHSSARGLTASGAGLAPVDVLP